MCPVAHREQGGIPLGATEPSSNCDQSPISELGELIGQLSRDPHIVPTIGLGNSSTSPVTEKSATATLYRDKLPQSSCEVGRYFFCE